MVASQLAFAAMLVAPEPGQKIIRFFWKKSGDLQIDKSLCGQSNCCVSYENLANRTNSQNFMYIKNIQTFPKIQISLLMGVKSSKS
jgi:hypothetical protein